MWLNSMNGNVGQTDLHCFDLITLSSGEVLSLCGTFVGPICRARLAFYPDRDSTRFIGGEPYAKVHYETGYQIAACEKVLDLPGEQHFLVHRSNIARIYKASEAFELLPLETFNKCQRLRGLLYDACQVSLSDHGLTGSGALQCMLPNSDLDWIVYRRDPTSVEAIINSSGRFKHDLLNNAAHTAHILAKYSSFSGLPPTELLALYRTKWKFFTFEGLNISMNFVDPERSADRFLRSPPARIRVTTQVTVLNSADCFHMPYIISIAGTGVASRIFSWLWLYNGAFETGQMIEVSGSLCNIDGGPCILVEGYQDYIRPL